MESVQEVYSETVSHWSSDEQLQLASLILVGVTKAKSQPNDEAKCTSMLEIINELPGGRLFKTSAEVDAYLREERDSWER